MEENKLYIVRDEAGRYEASFDDDGVTLERDHWFKTETLHFGTDEWNEMMLSGQAWTLNS